MKRPTTFLIIFIGASIGGTLRYLISLMFQSLSDFPWPTLLVNLTGAFFLPLLIHYLHDRYQLSARTVFSLTTGFLGAYTTFSTMTADIYHLYRLQQVFPLLSYLGLTMIGGFLCALSGNYLAAILARKYYQKNRQ